MKIFHLIQKSQLRGAEIFACQLSEELTKRGHECILITLFSGDAKLPFSGKILPLGLSKKKRFIDWAGWKKLAALIKTEEPDIVQANAGDTLKYAVISKLIFRWKTKLIFRNASTVSLYIKNPLIKKWNEFLYQHIDQIVSVSEHTSEDLKKMFPKVSPFVRVVPIGVELVDNNNVEPFQQRAAVLLHVGGFTFEKNHEGLIRIFQEIRRYRKDAVLWLVGDGPLRRKIEDIVKKAGLHEYVRFWGYQSSPGNFFKQANVFLLPSIIEGLPAVVLESFCHELPVVAYNVGGIKELVQNDKTGFLIEKGNEKKFSEATVRLLQSSTERALLGKYAREMVVREYTIHKVAERFEKIYEQIISRSDEAI